MIRFIMLGIVGVFILEILALEFTPFSAFIRDEKKIEREKAIFEKQDREQDEENKAIVAAFFHH